MSCVWFARMDEIRYTFASADGLCGRVGLPHCLLDFVDPVWTLEYFPRLGTIGSADNTVALHEVNEVGSVTDVQIVRGLQPELAQPVLEAIKRWRFRPALYKNQPIPFKARAELQFQRCADPRVTLSFLQ